MAALAWLPPSDATRLGSQCMGYLPFPKNTWIPPSLPGGSRIVMRDRTRGNGFKLKEGRLRLDKRKKFLTRRVVKHWNRLLREEVDAPSLETSKARLDGALSTLIQVKMSLLTAGGLDKLALKGPFQPKPFYGFFEEIRNRWAGPLSWGWEG